MKTSLLVLSAALAAAWWTDLHTTVHHHAMRLGLLRMSYPLRSITIRNSCPYDLWPAALNSSSSSVLPMGGGWYLPQGQSTTFNLSSGWSGRFWFRTNCSFGDGRGCETGDCGRRMQCNFIGGSVCSLAEFTMGDPDWYDVSGVDALTVPISITPTGVLKNVNPGYFYSCGTPSSAVDLRPTCPTQLQQHNSRGDVVGCNSGCTAFGTPQYCCTGQYGLPGTCSMNPYAAWFYYMNPTSYSYAYSDSLATYQCSGAQGYTIEACPSAPEVLPPGSPTGPLPLSAFLQTALTPWYPDMPGNATAPAGWPGTFTPGASHGPTPTPPSPAPGPAPAPAPQVLYTQTTSVQDANTVLVSIIPTTTATWCILHYTLGSQLNVPMSQAGVAWTYRVSGTGAATQSWLYSFTCNSAAGAFDTPTLTYNGKAPTSGISDSLVVSGTDLTVTWKSGLGAATSVILHYIQNGSTVGQQNVVMQQADTAGDSFTYVAHGYQQGNAVHRFYTYTLKNMGAQDSLWYISTP